MNAHGDSPHITERGGVYIENNLLGLTRVIVLDGDAQPSLNKLTVSCYRLVNSISCIVISAQLIYILRNTYFPRAGKERNLTSVYIRLNGNDLRSLLLSC